MIHTYNLDVYGIEPAGGMTAVLETYTNKPAI